MEVSSFLLDKTLFNTQSYPLFCVKREKKMVLPLEIPIDIPSLASSKMFHIFDIENYSNELSLIMICIMNC